MINLNALMIRWKSHNRTQAAHLKLKLYKVIAADRRSHKISISSKPTSNYFTP